MPRGYFGGLSKAMSLKSWLQEAYPRDLEAAFADIFDPTSPSESKSPQNMYMVHCVPAWTMLCGVRRWSWPTPSSTTAMVLDPGRCLSPPPPTTTPPLRGQAAASRKRISRPRPLHPRPPPHPASCPPPSASEAMIPARNGRGCAYSGRATCPWGPPTMSGRAGITGYASAQSRAPRAPGRIQLCPTPLGT